MKKSDARTRWIAGTAFAILLSGSLLLLLHGHKGSTRPAAAQNLPEQLVFVRSAADIADAGGMFIPLTNTTDPISVISVGGRDVIFQSSTYIRIGRAQTNWGS